MSAQEDQTTVTAQCKCKAQTFTATVPTSSLPLKSSLCHCTSCRRTTGALYSGSTRWPIPASSVDTSALSTYPFSSRLHILFCGTCSTPLFFAHVADGSSSSNYSRLSAFTGTLQNPPGLIEIEEHIFVGDTLDGGASMWLRKPNPSGHVPKRWAGFDDASDELPYDWKPATGAWPAADAKEGPDEVPFRCHCKGVSLVLRRGEAYYKEKVKAGEALPWFVDPRTLKYRASFDACDSCRLTFGVDIIHWTFALLQHMDFAEGDGEGASQAQAKFPKDVMELVAAVEAKSEPRLGTLAVYRSSPDVMRFYCSRCSASVFYGCDDRPDMLDVAIGLLDSPDGARAEHMLSWELGEVGFHEDSIGGWREGMQDCVAAEAEAWRIERGYPKGWRRLQREEAKAKADAKA